MRKPTQIDPNAHLPDAFGFRWRTKGLRNDIQTHINCMHQRSKDAPVKRESITQKRKCEKGKKEPRW